MVGTAGASGSGAIGRGARRMRALKLATLPLFAAPVLALALPASAQQASAVAGPNQAVAFSIAAQPLGSAINAFIRQTGWQISYNSALAAGKRSAPVIGSMTPAAALRSLVAGTGIQVRIGAPGSAALVDPAPASGGAPAVDGAATLGTVVVDGERADGPVDGYVASRSGTGSKVDVPLIETPQSISVVTRDQMDDQAVTTVSEALRYTAGVLSGQAGLQSRRFDPIFIRGFGGYSADASYVSYIDGLKWNFPARTAIQFDPFMIERVEIFKGPSSVLYGQATPGGFVNLVSKRPTEEARGEMFVRGGNYSNIEGGLDVSGPLDAEGKWLYRMIALGRTGETQVDFQEDQRILLAPSLTWRPNEDTSLNLQFVYQRDPKTSEASFVPVLGTVLPNPNGKLPNSLFTGDPNWAQFERTQVWGSYQFAHQFNDAVTFRQNALYGVLNDDFRGVDLSANNGLYYLQPDLRTVDRLGVWAKHNDNQSFTIDNQLEIKFATGPVTHTALLGLDYQYMDAPWQYGWGAAPSLDLYRPIYGQALINPQMRVNFQESLNQTGTYAQTISELGNWRLWLGGRYDWARTESTRYLISNGAKISEAISDSEAFTGRAGLVYLFDNGIAPYVSYSESFQPLAGTTSNGTPFEPTTGQQYEVGVKYQPVGYDAFITVSLFNITKQNVATVDPLTPLYATQTGEIRSRGLEIEGKASLGNGLNLTLAYSYTDAEVTKSNTTYNIYGQNNGIPGIIGVAAQLGKVPVGVPKNMASAWLDYKVPEGALAGFSIGGGVRYIGSTYGTDSNVWGSDPNVGLWAPVYSYAASKVPAFTLVDMVVGYDFGVKNASLKGVSVDVNAKNLFDKTYVASCNPFYTCYYGEGRTVLGTLRYKW